MYMFVTEDVSMIGISYHMKYPNVKSLFVAKKIPPNSTVLGLNYNLTSNIFRT